MDALIKKAQAELNRGKLENAILTFTEALSLGGNESFECLRGLGDCLDELERFDEALRFREKHYKLAKKKKSPVEKQRALTCKGNALFQLAADNAHDKTEQDALAAKALKSHRKSLAYIPLLTEVTEDERKRMVAACNFNIGNCCVLLTDTAEARAQAKTAFLETIELCRGTKGSHQLQHDALVAVGEVLLVEESWDDAIDALNRAKALAANTDLDVTRKLDCLVKLAVAHFQKRDYVAQKAVLRAAAKVVKASSASFDHASRSRVVADFRAARKNVDLAAELDACVAALDEPAHTTPSTATSTSTPTILAATAERAADICIELEQPARAIELYHRSVTCLEDAAGDTADTAPLHASLALTYQDLGQPTEAVAHFQNELAVHHRHGRLKDMAETHLRIAKVMDEADMPGAAAELVSARGVVDEVLGTDQVAESSTLASPDVAAMLQISLDIEAVIQAMTDSDDMLRAESTLRIDDHEKALEAILAMSAATASQSDPGDLSDGTDVSFTDSNPEQYDMDMPFGAGTTRVVKKATGNINRRNEQGETKLQQAVIQGDLAVVERLLAANASVNCFDNYGWTPLHEACNHGHNEIVKELLKQPEIRVNDIGQSEVKKMQLTPLHDAAGNGHTAICQCLVDSSADVSLKAYDGKTPLEKAIDGGNADTAEYLREVAKTQGLTEVLEEVADMDVGGEAVAYDSDDMVLQYVPQKAAESAHPTAGELGRGLRSGVMERQAAARARQLLGDSDPEGSDGDSDFEPVVYQRGSTRLTLADIALTHTHGYGGDGELGRPAKYHVTGVDDALGTAPTTTQPDSAAATDSLSWDSPSPVGIRRTPPNAGRDQGGSDADDALDRDDSDDTDDGMAVAAFRSDRNHATASRTRTGKGKKKRRVDDAERAASDDVHDMSRDSAAIPRRRSPGPPSGAARPPLRKRGTARTPTARAKGTRVGSNTSSRFLATADTSHSEEDEFVLLSPDNGTLAQEGGYADDGDAQTPFRQDVDLDIDFDPADSPPPSPAATTAASPTGAASLMHSSSYAATATSSFSVTAKIVDGRGTVVVLDVPDAAEMGTLESLTLQAYRGKYGTAPTVRRLANNAGETLRPFERVRTRIEPTYAVQIVVDTWPDDDSLASRVTSIWDTLSARDTGATVGLRSALDTASHRSALPASLELPRVGLTGQEPRLLAQVLHHATWIRVLDLCDNCLTDSFARLLGDGLSGMLELSELHLAGNAITRDGLPFVVSPARSCYSAGRPLTKLTVLDLSHNSLSGASPTCFKSLLDHSPLLHTLRLDFCGLAPSELAFLRRQKVMSKVSMCGTHFRGTADFAVARLALQLEASSLKHCVFVTDEIVSTTGVDTPNSASNRVLSLRGCRFDPAAIQSLLTADVGHRLVSLDVRQCNLETTSIDALLGCLGKSLRLLDLSGNRFGSEHARSLNAWLRSESCQLHELRTAACAMDVKAASLVLQALVPDVACPMPTLRVLDLTSQNIGQDGDIVTLGKLLRDVPCLEALNLCGHPWTDVTPITSAWLKNGVGRCVLSSQHGKLVLGTTADETFVTHTPQSSRIAEPTSGATAGAGNLEPGAEDLQALTTDLDGVWSDDDGF